MNRFLLLYLRSRRVPIAVAVVLAGIAAIWALNLASTNQHTSLAFGALAATIAAAALAPGLVGADLSLDRTAALAWPPRRAAHVVVGAAIVAGVLAATALTGHELAPATVLVRDAVGLCGLVALGAVVLGAGLAWIPAVTWTAALVMAGPQSHGWHQVALTWLVQPAGTTSATVTALALGVAGAIAYALAGSRA